MARAEKFSAANLTNKVLNGKVDAHWLTGKESFWFRKQHAAGHEYLLVDAATGRQQPAFDHAALASALGAAGETGLRPDGLPIADLRFSPDALQIRLLKAVQDIGVVRSVPDAFLQGLAVQTYRCDIALKACERARHEPSVLDTGELALPAPGEDKFVYVREHNLWLRDRSVAGADRQLTHDGIAHFAYGAWDEEAQDTTYVARRRAGAALAPQWVQWSPDGRYVAAMRVDLRDTPERTLFLEFTAGGKDNFTAPNTRRFPIISDKKVLTRVITLADTVTGQSVAARIDPAVLQDWAVMHFKSNYLWWDLPDRMLYLATATKDGRRCGLVAVNMSDGSARTIVEEADRQHYIFTNGALYGGRPNFHVTANGKEAIWYSQRSGFGHLYLYDARTGKLKNPITRGDWVVLELVRVDDARRMIYFTAGGKEAGANPYHAHLYRVGFDGGKVENLTPENAHHEISFSSSGRYFLDTYSTVAVPPVTVIRSADGKSVKPLVTADVSKLEAMGWKPPTPFVVKAADNKTDLYGVMYRPANFDARLKYAVLEYTYPGPQDRYAPRTYTEALSTLGVVSLRSLAELGFVAVFLDGRGTGGRDRAFRYAFLDTEDPFGAADHKAAIEHLAQQNAFMDIDRVGVFGISYGGYGAAHAALLFPDFFKVCVEGAGTHDWRYKGFPYSTVHLFGMPSEPDGQNYLAINNTRLADRLKHKFWIIHGDLDEQVHINQAFLMADALIKANKTFDMLIVPNAGHDAALVPYVMRRWQRYFVEYLGGPVER